MLYLESSAGYCTEARVWQLRLPQFIKIVTTLASLPCLLGWTQSSLAAAAMALRSHPSTGDLPYGTGPATVDCSPEHLLQASRCSGANAKMLLWRLFSRGKMAILTVWLTLGNFDINVQNLPMCIAPSRHHWFRHAPQRYHHLEFYKTTSILMPDNAITSTLAEGCSVNDPACS